MKAKALLKELDETKRLISQLSSKLANLEELATKLPGGEVSGEGTWWSKLTDEQANQLHKLHRSGQTRTAIEITSYLMQLKSAAGRPEYRKVIEEVKKNTAKAKSLNARWDIRAEATMQIRELSGKVGLAHRFMTQAGVARPGFTKDDYVGFL